MEINENDIDYGDGEFAVGFGDSQTSSDSQAAEANLESAFSEAKFALDSVRATMLARVDECIAECRESSGECVSCLLGTIDREIESNEILINNIFGKINDRVDQEISQAAAYTANLWHELTSRPQAGGPCPIGQHESAGFCVPDDPAPCPRGMHVDSKTHTCVPDGKGGDVTCGPCQMSVPQLIGPNICVDIPGCGGDDTAITPGGPPSTSGGSCPACSSAGQKYSGIALHPPPGQDCSIYRDTHTILHTLKDETGQWHCIACVKPDIHVTGTDSLGNPIDYCQECDEITCPSGAQCDATLNNGAGGCPPGDDTSCCCPQGYVALDNGTCQLNIAEKGMSLAATQTTCGGDSPGGTGCCTSGQTNAKNLITFDESTGTPISMTSPCSPGNWETFDSQPIIAGATYGDYINQVASETRSDFNAAYSKDKDAGWVAKGIMYALFSVALYFVSAAATIIRIFAVWLPSPPGCHNNNFKDSAFMMGVMGFFDRWFGIVPPQYLKYLTQRGNVACQQQTPSGPELDLAYLREMIDKDQWEFGLKLNGLCLDWHRPIYDAATTYVPGPQDIVHFMVRDVFDPEAVEQLNLSAEFDQKFDQSPLAQKLARVQGIDRETMLLYWQSHWQNIAPGQIYEMMHRLAPDQNATTPSGTPISFTLDEAEKLLKIADYPPAYIDHLLAISYRPILKRDIRAIFATTDIDHAGLVKLYRQVGYSPENSEIQANSMEVLAAKDRANFRGVLSAADVDRMFISGFIAHDKLHDFYIQAGLTDSATSNRIAAVEIKKLAKDQAPVISKLRTAYIGGRIDEDEYEQYLVNLGVPNDVLFTRLTNDKIIKSVSNKQVAAEKLCKFVNGGYITADEYQRRMVNLGYTEKDAGLMALSCRKHIAAEKLCKLFERGLISENEYVDRMRADGYSADDAMRLVGNCAVDIEEKRTKEIESQLRRQMQAAEKAENRAKRHAKEEARRLKALYPCKNKTKPDCVPPDKAPDPDLIS